MNTLAALMSKTGEKPRNPEVIDLCAIIDAHVSNIWDALNKLDGKTATGVKLESDKSARYDAE